MGIKKEQLKRQYKQLKIVRMCWTAPQHYMSVDDCKRLGCPYAGQDCMEMAFIDAMWLVDRLMKERKELKKRVERGAKQTE